MNARHLIKRSTCGQTTLPLRLHNIIFHVMIVLALPGAIVLAME